MIISLTRSSQTLLRLLLGILLPFVTVLLMLIALLSTPIGTQASLSLINQFCADQLRFSNSQGAFFSHHFTLGSLKTPAFKIQNISLYWHPAELIKGRLQVNSLTGSLHVPGQKQPYSLLIAARGNKQRVTLQAKLTAPFSLTLKGVLEQPFGLRHWDFLLSGEQVNLSKQWPTWPSDLTLAVHSAGRELPNGKLNGTVTLKTLRGSLRQLPVSGQGAISLAHNTLSLNNIKLHYGNGHFTAAGNSANQWDIRWQLDIPDLAALLPASSGKFFSAGSITGQRTRPALISSFNSKNLIVVENPIGDVTLKIDADTDLSLPYFQGNLHISDSTAQLTAFGLELKDIRLSATSNAQGQLALNGSLRSGKGQLQINGYGDLSRPMHPIMIHFKGQSITVSNTGEYQLIASPDLSLLYQKHKAHLSGTLAIPKALLAPQDFSGSTTLPEDIEVIENPIPHARRQRFEFTSKLALSLGDKVNLHLFGLSAHLGGDLAITTEPNSLTTAMGELRVIDGKYNFNNQDLTITHGNLAFTGGPLADPGLAISAEKRVKAIKQRKAMNISGGGAKGTVATGPAVPALTQVTTLTVGVHVAGTLQHPKVTLFSEPATLTQTDILSYLVLGYPKSQATSSDNQVLLQAASALSSSGNGQFDQLSRDLKSTLGLDTLGLESTTDVSQDDPSQLMQNTSLVLGKQLTRKLYLSYSIGLLEPINTLKLLYQFSKSWALQSDTNSMKSGVDLLYTIEH